MADKTALAESSQALLCAVADLLGKTKSNQIFDEKLYPEYADFRAKVGKNESTSLSKKNVFKMQGY